MRILWDFDGTLMDTYPVYAKLFWEALDKPCSEREMFDLLKVTFGHAFQTLGLTQEQVERLRVLERRLDPAQFHPFDGVEEVLAAAEINVIMTHKDRKNARAILRANRLEKYFTEIVTADDGFPLKPDPASYRYLHEKYHLDLAVGDRELDILPAKAIGIGTCLFQNHTPGADYYVDSYDDFFTVLGRKNMGNGRK